MGYEKTAGTNEIQRSVRGEREREGEWKTEAGKMQTGERNERDRRTIDADERDFRAAAAVSLRSVHPVIPLRPRLIARMETKQ